MTAVIWEAVNVCDRVSCVSVAGVVETSGRDLADVSSHVEAAVQLNAKDVYIVHWNNCGADMDAEDVTLEMTQSGMRTEPDQLGLVGVELKSTAGAPQLNYHDALA